MLVNNAGLVAAHRTITDDGHELTFAVNHLAPFLLTNLLLDRLRASAPSRVITVSSDAHYAGHIHFDDLRRERSWSSWGAYCDSKLANVMFTVALARRLEGTGVTATSLHPGAIRTRLSTGASLPARIAWALSRPFQRSAEHGASTIVHLATAPDGAELPGAYFADSRAKAPKPEAADPELTERLWRLSEELVGSA